MSLYQSKVNCSNSCIRYGAWGEPPCFNQLPRLQYRIIRQARRNFSLHTATYPLMWLARCMGEAAFETGLRCHYPNFVPRRRGWSLLSIRQCHVISTLFHIFFISRKSHLHGPNYHIELIKYARCRKNPSQTNTCTWEYRTPTCQLSQRNVSHRASACTCPPWDYISL